MGVTFPGKKRHVTLEWPLSLSLALSGTPRDVSSSRSSVCVNVQLFRSCFSSLFFQCTIYFFAFFQYNSALLVSPVGIIILLCWHHNSMHLISSIEQEKQDSYSRKSEK